MKATAWTLLNCLLGTTAKQEYKQRLKIHPQYHAHGQTHEEAGHSSRCL